MSLLRAGRPTRPRPTESRPTRQGATVIRIYLGVVASAYLCGGYAMFWWSSGCLRDAGIAAALSAVAVIGAELIDRCAPEPVTPAADRSPRSLLLYRGKVRNPLPESVIAG